MSLIVDREKCLACGVCVERCILDNIRVQTPPCRAACPVGINPQAYTTLLAMDRVDDALAIVYRDCPFPRILAYVCQAPCESACNRRHVDEPVSIKALKRALADGAAHPPDPVVAGEPTGKRVTIVGAGPAGMAAAVSLRQKGHAVTLLDALPEAGGMMLAGIPRFHLPDVPRRLDAALLDRIGVEQRYGLAVGKDVGWGELRAGADALLLAVGTHAGERLGLPGEDASGILEGMHFLKSVNLGDWPPVGPRVLVIGGGNVAVDAARAAIRLGAQDVQLACLESREEMPAFATELEGALEEGVTFNCTWGPERLLTEGGHVLGVELKRCKAVLGPDGRFRPTYDLNQRMTLPADTVIVAIGQSPDLRFLAEVGGEDVFLGGVLRVNPNTLETRLPGVFAAGDMTSGPTSVVEAMASGRGAAASIDRFIQGKPLTLERILRPGEPLNAEADFRLARRHSRAAVRRLPPAQRRTSFEIVEAAYDASTARREADRCLRCGKAMEFYGECWYCLPCEVECPTKALTLEIPYLVR